MASDEVVQSVPEGTSDDRLRRMEMALQGIYEISRILTFPARIELTLSNVVAAMGNYFELYNGLIVLLGEKDEPYVAVGVGWSETEAKQHFKQLPEEVVRQIIATRKPVIVENYIKVGTAPPARENWPEETLDGRCSLIAVPIVDRDRVIGAMMAESYCAVHPTPQVLAEETDFLLMVSNLVGQTVRVQALVSRDRERLMEEKRQAEKGLDIKVPDGRNPLIAGIVGESTSMHSILNKIRIVARSQLPVLLRGESGTGKELFAQAVHDLSPRNKGPLVKVNCAALPETMLESELFGHEKGAFTGALTQRKGRFESADGGTLFLDEIGDISPAFQAKLLRVLQEGEFQRVGSTETIKVDVRVVAATNRNLEEAVSRGEFRSDLYFRISVVPILVTPLRERREDIPLLAREFLRRYNTSNGSALEFSEDAIELLCNCEFPGNIRELESCVRRTAAFSAGTRIAASDFACQNDSCLSSLLWKTKPDAPRGDKKWISLPVADVGFVKPNRPMVSSPSLPNPAAAAVEGDGATGELGGDLQSTDPSHERGRLVEAMERAGWVQAKAARLLGLTSRQMGYALRKHGIEIKRF